MELSDLLTDELLAFCPELENPCPDKREATAKSEYEVATSDIPRPLPAAYACLYSGYTEEPHPSHIQQRFAPPKTEQEIQEARNKGVPKKTLDDTRYCVRVWQDWCDYRQQVCGDQIELTALQHSELEHWLIRFVVEVRKEDGTEYPPKTIHHLCAGIMRFLRWNGSPSLDLLKDPEFANFRATLDAEMKRLQAQGLGSKSKQAEPLTEADKEILWNKGLLGDSSPRMLLNTIIFMNGLYFALRSGSKHRALRFSLPQIKVVEREGERPYLEYIEDISKNRPGGLKGRTTTPKVVRHHSNLERPDQCFVRLFKLYLSHCPADPPKDALYLQPLNNPKSSCWYSKQPLGRHKLAETCSSMQGSWNRGIQDKPLPPSHQCNATLRFRGG